jgi:hypothetical protein
VKSKVESIADWVSAAIGRPVNILIWFTLILGWTLLFALGGSHLDSGKWMPSWFTSTGFNFPLNLITTVAELFIGFLVAAAANRSEKNLKLALDKITNIENRIVDLLDVSKPGGITPIMDMIDTEDTGVLPHDLQ